MNEQAGPASVLSVLIVGAFAILLYDKDRSPPPPKPGPPSAAPVVPKPREPEPSPPHPAPASPMETALIAPAPKVRALEPSTPRPGPEGKTVAPDTPVPVRPARMPRPRGDFTVVEPGETLADVAERVYGSGRAAESLWKANRDQLASLESPLPRGTLLRTP